ncbi:MAG: YceI family protein [Egibacteraceae bacterium]
MNIPPGKYEFGPDQALLQVHTFREGMARKVGHDLIMQAGTWHAIVEVDEDVTKSTVTASVDVPSITAVQGTGGVKPLSDGDRADIKKNMVKSLNASKHPEITFRSTSVENGGGDSLTVHGDLTIAGTTRPATLDVSLTDGAAKVTTTIVQSQWGIKPYSGLMGALKVRDAVDFHVEGTVPPPD